jgi:hypothetical protein
MPSSSLQLTFRMEPKGSLKNNLYTTEELAYVLRSEELRETGQDVTVTGRTLLVAGDEYLE